MIYNFTCYIDEVTPEVLKNRISEILKFCGYNIIGSIDYHFNPCGYTCLWLLSESHCAIHTFPESSKSYIELSGCSLEKNETFVKLLNKSFKISNSN
jgi:S-adenosylmethionine/arginine decarboxylase-like enzyme